MKTITTLLMTGLFLAGTCNTIQADDNARAERNSRAKKEISIKREVTSERSRGNRENNRSRVETDRRTDVQTTARHENRDLRVSTTNIRNERRERNLNRKDNNQRKYVYRRDNERRAEYRYHERKQQCSFCTGRGFTIHLDGRSHLRCNHCEGLGIRVFRELYVNACPVCYDPLRNENLDCSLEDLAWMETNRIALALELSDHQRNRVFDINYRYITHHFNGENYTTSRRDREIRRVLRLGQIVAFTILLNEFHNGDLCYNCSNGGN